MKLSIVTTKIMHFLTAHRFPNMCVGCANTARSMHISNKNGLQVDAKRSELPEYSNDEQTQILRVINEYSSHELSRFDVTKRRAENLNEFRTKHGKFRDLEHVLNVTGLGVRGLERLCDSILVMMAAADQGGGTFQLHDSKPVLKKAASKTSLLIPMLSEQRRRDLNVAVGIHIGINSVSWAGIDRNKRLLEWGLYEMGFEPRKMHPTSILATVLEVRNALPEGDAYILEDVTTTNQPMQQQITSLSVQLQKSQLSAMMLAVLNTTDRSLANDTSGNHDRVFYLRSRTPARLFRTLVGSERVSAQSIVRGIVDPRLPDAAPSPAHCSPILVDDELREAYAARSNVDRENMCQALLLTIAFMDLMVFQTPQSLKAATGR